MLPANKQLFGLPKGRKTRDVPLPDAALEAINAHMTRRPPVEVTLPWETSTGKLVTVPLLLYSREKKALGRNYFNAALWRNALERAGVEPNRTNGCHALRHFYASTALHEGESRTVHSAPSGPSTQFSGTPPLRTMSTPRILMMMTPKTNLTMTDASLQRLSLNRVQSLPCPTPRSLG